MKKKDENMFGWNDTIRKMNEAMPAHLPRHESPPTVADVLLKTWAQDEEKLARMLIEYAMQNEYYYDGLNGQRLRGDWETALAGEIAYLNSAAEVGK